MNAGMVDALLLAGRSGVGKTTVSYEISALLRRHDIAHALIDGDNLDEAYPKPAGSSFAEANLAAIWRNYQALGHRRVIYVNTVSVLEAAMIRRALGGSVRVTGILLTADERTIRARLEGREVGSGLDLHLKRSVEAAAHLDRAAQEWVHRVSTIGRTVAEIAVDIVTVTDWTEDAPRGGGDRS